MHWCLKPLEENTPQLSDHEPEIIDDMLDCRSLISTNHSEPFTLEADCFDLDHDPEGDFDAGTERYHGNAEKCFSIADLFHLRIGRSN